MANLLEVRRTLVKEAPAMATKRWPTNGLVCGQATLVVSTQCWALIPAAAPQNREPNPTNNFNLGAA